MPPFSKYLRLTLFFAEYN
uniref:Uncharacterized protein n=1 Tax=Arundo donax TaxID=35708 RepID=A0A0A8ZJK5_ARUDO